MIQGIREDKEVQKLIQAEAQRESLGIELIASENYQSSAVLQAQASVFANKYAEGFPWKRYYWGQENTDKLETLAIERAKAIFMQIMQMCKHFLGQLQISAFILQLWSLEITFSVWEWIFDDI